MSAPQRWTLADLIDFEFLLASESGAPAAASAQDQEAVRSRLRELAPGREPTRRDIFKAWLEVRREAAGHASLPGEHFAAGWQTLVSLSALVGLFLGGSLVAALLHYKGDEPVNVSWFLVCTLGVQLLILAVALLLGALQKATRIFETFRPLQWILSGVLWSLSSGLRRLPGEQREKVRAALAVIRRKREIYGSLATWPFLVVTQVFAVAYNAGMVAILLAHVATTDLAFGWQSTLQTSPEQAFALLQKIASPWAWLVPNAHPTLGQVIESRFQYSTGLKPLSDAAMASWWPFLCYAILFYGLLIRGVILLFAALRMRLGLAGLTLDHQGCNALFRRLTGPVVHAQSGTAILEIPESPAQAAPHAVGRGRCLALVAAELSFEGGELPVYLEKTFGWDLGETLAAQVDRPSGNLEVLAKVREQAGALAAVVVVVRSKRSPIKAIALFLQKVMAAAAQSPGAKPEVLLLLVGRREGEVYLPIEDEEFAHWRNFNEINGLHLTLEKWRP